MSKVIAIHWNESSLPGVFLDLVIVERGQVNAVSRLAIEPELEPTAIGRKLAEALEPHAPGRAKVIVAVGRGALDWQHLSLPPCPADELADVVRLQADRDLGAGDEDLGFDFLPLVGDEHTPYQVLTAALPASELVRIRQVCRAADLNLDRLVPLATGWSAIARQSAPTADTDTHIFVTPWADEAILWATRAGQVVLFRQVQFSMEDPAALVASLGSELRRTLLALSQHTDNSSPNVSLIGGTPEASADLAKSLSDQLGVAVQAVDVTTQHPQLLDSASNIPTAWPLAGLAIDESNGVPPLVDLLHPHRRPKAQSNIRTYALAGVAGALLIGWLGWLGYAKLQAPLDQVAKDRAELAQLEESLDDLKEAERRAAAIRDWENEAANLLIHLQQLSEAVRPVALDAENYPVDQDVLLDKFGLDKRRLTVDGLARNSRALQPLELRLREADYRPERGKSDPSQTVKDYPWHFQSTIKITPESDTAVETPSEDVERTAIEESPS